MKLKRLLHQAWLYAIALGWTSFAHAQTDVTSKYIKNPSFELASEGTELTKVLSVSNQALSMYGWTESGIAESWSNSAIMNKSTENPSAFGKKVTPADGTYYFFVRQGWRTSTFAKITSNEMELPTGTYTLSVAYKQAYSYQNSPNSNTKTSLAFIANGSDLAVSTSDAAPANPTSDYFVTEPWSTLTTTFAIGEPTKGNIEVRFAINGQIRSDFLVDNVKLYYSEVIKTELEAAITKAEQYNAVLNNEDLTNAINASKTVFDNAVATQNEVDSQITSLNNAILSALENIPAGTDITSIFIKNPDFETGNTDNWTIGVTTTDTGARETSNETYEAQGSGGKYLFNIWSDGGALTQNLGVLPAGIYQLSAMLATGDSKDSKGTVYLTVNDIKSQGMVSRYGNKKVMHKETLTFVSDGTTETTIGAVGKEISSGHWWYKADNFKLVFVDDTENLSAVLSSTLSKTQPWTTEGDYYTKHNTYSGYTSSNTQSEILTAINYLNTEYDNYKWENASEEHPYIMENVIKDAGHTDPKNTYWTGSTGRLVKEITDHWSGGDGKVFMANTEGYIRNQTVTVPYEGKYILKTAVRTLTDGAWASIKMGDVENTTTDKTGNTGGDVNIDGTEGTDNRANGNAGYGWTFNKIEYISTTENSNTSIGISLSRVDNSYSGLQAQTAGMFLCYVGDKFEYTKNGAHYYHGDWTTGELSKELTEEVPVLDLTYATVTGDVDITATNKNGLVYTKSANTITGITDNVVIDGTCQNLVLTDGYPFTATKSFTATDASYNMSKIAETSSGATFGTLMLPYAVTTLPGKAYSLDQGVTFGGDIYATEVSSINANTPVLVTASGKYEAKGVSVAPTADTHTNGELVGTYKKMTALDNTYVLQKHNNYVAFFMVDAEKTTTKPTVNPFRAYIKPQSGASSKQFINVILDGETTAISNVENQNSESETIYDLSGRKVTKAGKGVYIINGKKIVK